MVLTQTRVKRNVLHDGYHRSDLARVMGKLTVLVIPLKGRRCGHTSKVYKLVLRNPRKAQVRRNAWNVREKSHNSVLIKYAVALLTQISVSYYIEHDCI